MFLQVNLPHELSTEILDKIREGHVEATMFDKAEGNIVALMCRDSFMRFSMEASDEEEALLQEIMATASAVRKHARVNSMSTFSIA